MVALLGEGVGVKISEWSMTTLIIPPIQLLPFSIVFVFYTYPD
jgi:hypothetical protein